MTIPIAHVDAFTSEPSAGNPAAVCLLPAARETAWMRAVPREMNLSDRLTALGISLPPLTPAVAAFLPFVRAGNLTFVSGHIARRNGQPWVRRLGAGITIADGQAAARGIAIELLGALHAATADLDAIVRIVKPLVLVNSAPTFTEPHLVANGASDVINDVFGERGPHARSAIGVAQLPLGACVEIELIAEVAPADAGQ